MSEELIQKLTSIELDQASIHSRALALSDRLNRIESGHVSIRDWYFLAIKFIFQFFNSFKITNGISKTNGVEVVKEKTAAELQKEAKKKEKDEKFKEKQAKLAAAAASASTKEPKAKVEKSTEPLSSAQYTSKTVSGEKKGQF